MHRTKKALLLIWVLSLTGCTILPKQAHYSENTFTSMETEPDLSYEVPVSSPNIFVNQLGYIPDGTKVAVFCGKELPDRFHVVEKETGEIVFTGYLEEQGYQDESQEYNSYGDFTEVSNPGTYYIEAPIIGRSYSFMIEKDLYGDVFKEACRQYYYNRCGMTLTSEYAGEMAHNACHTGRALVKEDTSVSMDVNGGWHQDESGSKMVEPAARSIAIILLAYELYGDAFTDDMGIPESGNEIPDILDEVRYEVEWLLKMQDPATGAVYSGVTVYEQGAGKGAVSYVEPVDLQAARSFAMVLAKFSYLYQFYDTEYATECLKAADRAWRYAQLNEGDDRINEWKLAAAAELYRASGKQEYHSYISDYLSKEDYTKMMDEVLFLGGGTYISTKQPVKLPLCEEIIETLMTKAEEISETARNSLFLTGGSRDQDNIGELLLEMMYMTLVNHVISNHEYENVIENHLHYFMGRNQKAISYIDNVGENNYRLIDENLGIMKRFEADSRLIFMLSEIVSAHGD